MIAVTPGVHVTLALANPSATARRKIARRLLPFLLLIYMTAFIDRVNVGFAGLDMTRELHFLERGLRILERESFSSVSA